MGIVLAEVGRVVFAGRGVISLVNRGYIERLFDLLLLN